MFHPCNLSIHEHSKQWINTTGIDSTTLGFIPWEDRSTLLAMIHFLSTYWDPQNIKSPTFVYIGDHRNGLAYIPELFPNVQFRFFTSTKPKGVKNTKQVKWEGIKQVDQYYEDFLEIKETIFLFCSFIPTQKDTLEVILENQMTYIDEIDPIHAWLTFSMEKETKRKTMKYLQGFIYWKIWAEDNLTWLKPVKKGENYYNRTWDKDEYNQWVDYQYVFGRRTSYHNPFTGIPEAIQKPSLLNDFDDLAEVSVLMIYIKKFLGSVTLEKVLELSQTITHEINKEGKENKTLESNRILTKELPEDPFRKKLVTKTKKKEKQAQVTVVTDEKKVEKYKRMKEELEGIKK